MEPLFLKPVLQEKIWGGTKLNKVFGFELPNDKIGEAWAISAHPNGTSLIENGLYAGKGLDKLWEQQPQLFGYPQAEKFPLLTKILDAEENLSVQVHPDDDYGRQNEGELGKTECWYIIDAIPDAEIIYGHHAKTKENLGQMIVKKKWTELLNRVPVKSGDFFYVPSGTIHAIGKGILILETQQSSDTTYRVYDYDRKDEHGQTRKLHLKQSIDVTNIEIDYSDAVQTVKQIGDSTIITYLKNNFFSVYKWEIDGELEFEQQAPYLLLTVISGSASLLIADKNYQLRKGMSCLLPNDIKKWSIIGLCEIIASEPPVT